jgi:hypothetical protein
MRSGGILPGDDAGKRNGRRNEFSSRLLKENGQGCRYFFLVAAFFFAGAFAAAFLAGAFFAAGFLAANFLAGFFAAFLIAIDNPPFLSAIAGHEILVVVGELEHHSLDVREVVNLVRSVNEFFVLRARGNFR